MDVKNVHGYIIGEHGDSQLPLWSATHIAGRNIKEFFGDPSYNIDDAYIAKLMDSVKNAGAEIIKRKGATYYAIAVSINTILESLLKNQNTIRTVSSVIIEDNTRGSKRYLIKKKIMIQYILKNRSDT